jgi:hypothetical protein
MPNKSVKPGEPGTTQLRRVAIAETSGVDHPAHKHPGWLLMKSIGNDKADALVAAFGKEGNMPVAKETPVLTGLLKSLEGADRPTICDAILKADENVILKELTEADIAPARDAVAGAWKILRDLADKGNAETPSVEAVAAPDAESVLASADLQKAVGANGVALLKSIVEKAAASDKALEEERAASFTKSIEAEFGETIEKADIEPLAKALRAMDADAAAVVRKALTKSKELNASAEAIITSEIGAVGMFKSGSAADQLSTIAKGYVESGAEKTYEQAFAKACSNNEELYNKSVKEGA